MALDVVVSVIDDDDSVRESLPGLLTACGFTVRAFASAEAFIAAGGTAGSHCLILDVEMPGISGPKLYRQLLQRGQNIPTIFITAMQDELLRQRLLCMGALECLSKPFGEEALLQALKRAVP